MGMLQIVDNMWQCLEPAKKQNRNQKRTLHCMATNLNLECGALEFQTLL